MTISAQRQQEIDQRLARLHELAREVNEQTAAILTLLRAEGRIGDWTRLRFVGEGLQQYGERCLVLTRQMLAEHATKTPGQAS